MAPRQVSIALVEPRLDHDEREVTAIVLREPNLDEVFRIGEPIEITRSKAGEIITIEHPEALRAYLELLVVEPTSKAIVRSLSLADALRVKDEIHGFFLSARLLSSPSLPSSSSNDASST